MGTDLVDEFLGTGRTTHRTVLIVLRPGERYERVACRRDKRATRNRGPMRISAIGPLAVGSSLGRSSPLWGGFEVSLVLMSGRFGSKISGLS